MNHRLDLKQVISILNWLFVLFPLSFIAGNFLVNFHFLLFILFGVIYLKKKKIVFEYDYLLLIFFLFSLTLIIASVFNQFNIGKSITYLRFLFFYFICYYLIKDNKFNIERLLNYYAIFVLIITLDVIIQYSLDYNIVGYKIIAFGQNQTEVPTSFFFDEPIAGNFIQSFGFYFAFIVFYKFRKNNILNLLTKSFLISLMSISIFLSYQRMPMILWVTFLLAYGGIYYKSKLFPILFSFIFFFMFVINFSSKEITENYDSFFKNIKTIGKKSFFNYKVIKDKELFEKIKVNESIKSPIMTISDFEKGSGHASLFAETIYIWEDSKIFGIGYKNFYNKCVEKKLTRCTTHPHNLYFDVLVSTGLLGLIFLIVLLILLFFKIIYF